MARYPGATWRPISMKHLSGRKITRYDRCNLHTQAGNGSLYDYFNAPGRASSHFWVGKRGQVEQYVDTIYEAEADLQGNSTTVSIETEGSLEAWTPAQLAAIIKLVDWVMTTHKIRRKLATTSFAGAESSKGLSWHRLGVDGNFPTKGRYAGRLQNGGGLRYSNARGKVCPGNARIDQIHDEVAPAVFGGKTTPASNTRPATPKAPVSPTGKHILSNDQVRARLKESGVPYPKDGLLSTWVRDWQRRQLYAPGLTADGVWGRWSESHYQWTKTLQRTMKKWKGSRDTAVDGDYYTATRLRVREIQQRNRGGAYQGALDSIPGPVFCRMLGIPTHPGL